MGPTELVKDSVRVLKRSLRIGLKFAKDIRQGYLLSYASRQASSSHKYPYLWCESKTPIPDRGCPEVRKNRIFNLQRATRSIHQLQIEPKRVFSFCNRVGDPSLRNGYRAGAVFVGGKVQTGAGGGLCLIATNLFHLFLNAGCEILERHAHSIDAYGRDRFYKLGQDAAIAYGYKDLIIRNQSEIPLVLNLQVQPAHGQVVSSLWGQSPCPWQVEVSSIVLQELRSNLSNGISGWEVETRRIVSAKETSHPTTAQPSWNSSYCENYCAKSLYAPCGAEPGLALTTS